MAAAIIKKLSSNLRLIKEQLANVVRSVDEFDENVEDEFTLRQYVSLLNGIQRDQQAKMRELFEHLPDEKVDEWVQTDLEFTKSHLVCMADVQRFLAPYAKNIEVKQETKPKASIKLPDIQLPTFNGHYSSWLFFKEKFEALITKNENLDDIHRLHYLKGCLKEEAADLQAQNDSFQSLWVTLVKRYEVKRVIVEGHINDLMKLKKMTGESAGQLRVLLDGVVKNIRALQSIDLKVEGLAEQFIINIVTTRLDCETRKAYESQLRNSDLPTWDRMIGFLRQRGHTLEAIESTTTIPSRSSVARPFPSRNIPSRQPIRTSTNVTSRESGREGSRAERVPMQCHYCQKSHSVYRCPQLQADTAKERLDKVKKLKLCVNCLQPGHEATDCSHGHCRVCSKKHNTLVHHDTGVTTEPQPSTSWAANCSTAAMPAKIDTVNHPANYRVMTSTAIVVVIGGNGQPTHVRALIDHASESNFVTERVVQLTRSKRVQIEGTVIGFQQQHSSVTSMTTLTIQSTSNNFTVPLDFLVTSNICADTPTRKIDLTKVIIPEGVTLADPQFGTSQPIDILIGAELAFDIFTGQTKFLNDELPPLRETWFGWVVGGRSRKIQYQIPKRIITTTHVTNVDLQNQLKQFWELESCQRRTQLSRDERLAEDHFAKTVTRQPDGRYVVELPTKVEVNKLGDSRKMATNRFLSLERKLNRSPKFKEDYTAFISEYLNLGHMELSTPDEQLNYYIPHHAVLRPESSTTKLRVVFDASATTSAGLSLNNVVHVGPTVQQELFDIVLRFRKHNIAFTADISKMYRQVLVHKKDQALQQILWRSSAEDDLQSYRLKTVTYGTACAPFLATRVLQQLAIDEEDQFPIAAKAALTDFYVDDFLSGADDVEHALALQRELIALLSRGGFALHKWSANTEELLQAIPPEKREKKGETQEAIKALGVVWRPIQDTFVVAIDNLSPPSSSVTKREVLADIARLFDPLGLVGPIVLTAKIILQQLWQAQVTWDEPLSVDLAEKWIHFREQLAEVGSIEVPRRVVPFDKYKSIQLIGFCDGSTTAYGAAVYVLSTSYEDRKAATLLCAKSRVAPLKTITVPRLELCGAVLLSELLTKARQALCIENIMTTIFTDSTIVLGWVSSEANKTKTFVAHRVAEIQNATTPEMWRHVPTDQNPADLISRGVMPGELSQLSLWWHGPAFLTLNEEHWPTLPNAVDQQELPEMKTTAMVVQNASQPNKQQANTIIEVINRVSTLRAMVRKVAYIKRFITNCQIKTKSSRAVKHLTTGELQSSIESIVRVVQRQEFAKEFSCLKSGESLPEKSPLQTLNIFLDKHEIIRVGGRIRNAPLPFETKHQMVLPKKNHFTISLARALHIENGHVGQQGLLAIIRQTYWPLRAKDLVNWVTRRCVVCFRCQPKPVSQPIGNLPVSRVELLHPFVNTGVDYAGPLQLKLNRRTSIKCYVAVFVCMATKAVHLEVVSDLSTQAFLAALTRFVARRGLCRNIFSDNGTNFVGARAELATWRQLIANQKHQDQVATYCADHQIEFHFIPPRAPHFGGLWEAAVKSFKFHLVRIVGPHKMTFEEVTTILTKVEGILNSRPLVAVSNDPNDLGALTPGHLLVGRPLNAPVEPNYSDVNIGRLDRWQLLQQLSQHFWRRWAQEYLTSLQQRIARHASQPTEIHVGMLVVIKEDNLPPMLWALGRITKVHPGTDGVVRAVTVKTNAGEYKRPSVKICILPTQDNEP